MENPLGKRPTLHEALFWEKLGDKEGRCHLCAHECRISESGFGICGVRQNIQGTLFTHAYGEVIAANVDPIEKKPLYHFLPGSRIYSVATIGCNFKCGFCQNWQISQVSVADGDTVPTRPMTPQQIVSEARRNNCLSIAYTYTEPTIFFEYAYDTAKAAKEAGIRNVFVTNGYMTRLALEMMRPCLDAANVDLKGFSDASYRRTCKARLQPVLDTLVAMKELGIWLEVTTLVIPGENDSEEELRVIAEYLAGIDVRIPWHLSRFHPDYEFQDHVPTPMETLLKAREIGKEAGLKYIYLGNVVEEGTDTTCERCHERIIERRYMGLKDCRLKGGRCPSCGSGIEGVWS
ncbi:MAG: AmmeMemoRadiSam system radical SAM enzyme [Deltaproteobacteria bacterium]|nr:AmmeMemoRadiSam system radical SAM enzyme [Deltaproteobacteria bacterium]